jgi:hypothetical protein
VSRRFEIWSGGQTGVDRAALDVARELGFPIGGWIPRGRVAEDGVIPAGYAELRETDSTEYAVRTERNVRDTDATLILRWGEATGGTLETILTARRLGRPLCEQDLATTDADTGARAVAVWLAALPSLRRVNVAGPRASQAPAAYNAACALLRRALLERTGT